MNNAVDNLPLLKMCNRVVRFDVTKSYDMNSWKTSLYAQIIYMAVTGAGLLATPQLLSDLLHIGPVAEIWVRLLGLLAMLLCLYYYQAIQNDARWFAQVSSYGRFFFTAGFALLAWFFNVPVLIALAALEFLLAVWTWRSLANKA